MYHQLRELLRASGAAIETGVDNKRTLHEPGHPLIAHILNLLTGLSYEQGNYEQAEQLWKQSLSILEKTLGLKHLSCAETLNDLAVPYFAQGLYTKAQSYCQRALASLRKYLGLSILIRPSIAST